MSAARHINLWRVAAENVWRNAGKSVSVWVPLTVAVTVFAALSFLRDGMVMDASRAADVMPDLTVQAMVGGRAERLHESVGAAAARMADVSRVAGRIWGYVPITTGGLPFTYTMVGLDLRNMPRPEGLGMVIESGRYLDERDTHAAVLGKGVAAGLHVEVGDTLSLTDELGNSGRFHVVGLFASAVQIHTADLIVVPLQGAREFFGYRDGEVTDVCVYLKDPASAGAVAAELQGLAKSTRILSKETVKNAVVQVYGSRAGVFQAVWLILLLTVMLVAWAEAKGANARLCREIGILKATGWGTTDIIELRAYENLIVAAAATLSGMVLALGYLLANAPGIKSYFLGWSVLYPDMAIPVGFNASTVTLIAAVGIFPFLVATIVPAWAAGIIDPDEAMRG